MKSLKKLGLTAALLGTTALVGAWSWIDDINPGDFSHVTNLFSAWGSNQLVVYPDGTLSTRAKAYNGTDLSFSLLSNQCTGAATTAAGINFNPPAGQYTYINSISLSLTNYTTTSAAEVAAFTLTNFRALPASTANSTVSMMASAQGTQGAPGVAYNATFNPPIKSLTPGTLSQLSGPTAAANIAQCALVSYAYGP